MQRASLASFSAGIASLPAIGESHLYPEAPLTLLQLQQYRDRMSPSAPYVTVANGILFPPPRTEIDLSTARVQGGVTCRNGTFDPVAHHYSSIWPWVESEGQWRGQAGSQPGRVLYGGVAREHFGHFLAESLGRIWYAFFKPDDRLDSLCFLRSPIGPPSVEGLQALALFSGLPPVQVVDEPTQVDEVVIPLQATAAELGMVCVREVAVMLRENFAPQIEFSGDRSIYVSRSRIAPPAGRPFSGTILQEKLLETLLSESGYEVYHPQEHDVAHQVQTYRSASRILINEGSALHLVALSAAPTARVAVIARRIGLVSMFEAYLEAFLGLNPMRRVLRNGFGIKVGGWGEIWLALDYPQLSAQLARRGMLAAETVWPKIDVGFSEVHQRVSELEPEPQLSQGMGIPHTD
ncbi:glycosyltransferase 61 family protein [Ottowia thiooxydans]|uniref:glycosyltransferase 61 family protein n=1 Tax=Ottowia thiooxydans TaxID=219182 RepID=UPI0012EC6720|nr:glycosyltransferase 61 family protein [Ottowia thiooxydans]